MKLNLAAARAEEARLQGAWRRANAEVKETANRLVWKPAGEGNPIPKDTDAKYRTERPYLPKNRRCKRFAVN